MALNADEALAGHLLVSAQYGDKVANPTPLDELKANPDVQEVHGSWYEQSDENRSSF